MLPLPAKAEKAEAGPALPGEKAGWGTYVDGSSFSYSETIPVQKWIFDPLDGSTRAGEEAFSSNHAEAGIRYGGWSFGALYRWDYYASFDYDTFELVRAEEKGRPLDPGRTYRLKVDANHFEGWGLRLAYSGELWSVLEYEVGVGYLSGLNTIEGRLDGELLETGSSYDAEAFLYYGYWDDRLLNRQARTPDGHGIQTDLKIRLRPHERVLLHAQLRDLFTSIYWRNRPYTRAQLTFDNVDFDDDGFIISTPLISGVERYEERWQQIPMTTTVGAEYQITDRISLASDVRVFRDIALPRISAAVDLDGWAVGASYRFIANSVGFSVASPWIEFAVESDSPNPAKARTLAFSLRALLSF